MDQKFRMLLAAMCAALCCLCGSNQARGETLPDGKGKAEFVHNCTACHRADMVTRVKKSPDEWRKSVDEMAARGTDGTKEDLDNVVLYLDTYFATGNATPGAATQSTTSSSTSSGSAALNSS
ncbi:MAG: cytochrome c, partial [Terracidiphilus sp.]